MPPHSKIVMFGYPKFKAELSGHTEKTHLFTRLPNFQVPYYSLLKKWVDKYDVWQWSLMCTIHNLSIKKLFFWRPLQLYMIWPFEYMSEFKSLAHTYAILVEFCRKLTMDENFYVVRRTSPYIPSDIFKYST